VASIDAICTPCAFSSAASSVIAGTVAGTECSCDLRCFLPSAGGIRAHTTAESFARSSPATTS
jgi:hypothetical protein